jgi:hypothetical protein
VAAMRAAAIGVDRPAKGNAAHFGHVVESRFARILEVLSPRHWGSIEHMFAFV